MSLLGVNVSPSGLAAPADLHTIGCTHVRIPLWPDHAMRTILRDYREDGITVLPCTDSRSLSVAHDPVDQARFWHAEIGDLVEAVQWGSNEFDQVGSTSSTAPEAAVYAQLKAARKVFSRHLLVGPNCASGQPDRWTKRLDNLVDVVALSRYPDQVSKMGDGIFGPQGYARYGKPIWFGEFPIWSDAYVAEARRLSERAYAYCWKSWWQDKDTNWDAGLVGIDGKPTWRWETFRAFSKESDMAFNVSPQLLEKMKAKGDVPLGDEVYDPVYNNSETPGRKYIWKYNHKSNITYIQPAWDLPNS